MLNWHSKSMSFFWCQMSTYKKARVWRTRRKRTNVIDRMRNIPPQTPRNSCQDGSQLIPGIFDPSLISYRNPKGSRYVDRLIEIIDQNPDLE